MPSTSPAVAVASPRRQVGSTGARPLHPSHHLPANGRHSLSVGGGVPHDRSEVALDEPLPFARRMTCSSARMARARWARAAWSMSSNTPARRRGRWPGRTRPHARVSRRRSGRQRPAWSSHLPERPMAAPLGTQLARMYVCYARAAHGRAYDRESQRPASVPLCTSATESRGSRCLQAPGTKTLR